MYNINVENEEVNFLLKILVNNLLEKIKNLVKQFVIKYISYIKINSLIY